MKNTRTKIIVGFVAIITAGSLFALKGKMMHHHRMAKSEHCQKMKPHNDKKMHNHHDVIKFKSEKAVREN